MEIFMERVYSFASSPAMLPTEVIEEAAASAVNYNNSGLSLMEIGKSCREYSEIYSSAEELLREILNVPQGYKVFFYGGGSSAQYAAIPLNLLSDYKCADYVVTGRLSKNASLEAKKYGDIALAATSAGASPAYSTVPVTKRQHFRPDADYAYICYNDPTYGTKYGEIPDTGNIPLVADMTSFLFTEPIDISKFALVFANADYGFGIGGLTVVIVRDDFTAGAMKGTPSFIDYKAIEDTSKDFSPASAWSVYLAKLFFEWIKSVGGLEEIKRRNERKASFIYDYLDSQTYYTAPVDKKCRSMMNVIFFTGDAGLDKKFVDEARDAGLVNLGGSSYVGGMCASLYNAMPIEGVERLVAFMKQFAQENLRLDA